MSNENFQGNTDFTFSPVELSNIYLSLSENLPDFQDKSLETDLLEIINLTFNVKLRQIDTSIFFEKPDILNKSFAKFYKVAREFKYPTYKIFIFYCDYYDLNYNKVYLSFTPRLKELIENDLILLVGGWSKYDKLCKKMNKNKNTQNTIFDLI